MPEKNQDQDFQKVIDATTADSYIEEKKVELEKKIKPKKTNEHKYAWVLVFVLMLTLVGLGSYSLYMINEKDIKITKLEEKQVAGTAEIEDTYISGDGFTFIISGGIPEGYKLDRRIANFQYSKNQKNAVINSFIAQKITNNQTILSGLEITVSEYDTEFKKDDLAQEVLKTLDKSYVIKAGEISIPKNITLTQISSEKYPDITYYTTITDSNYYVIKEYNQTQNRPEQIEYTRFVDTLLNTLYLN